MPRYILISCLIKLCSRKSININGLIIVLVLQIADELESLLVDNNDMSEMYLIQKLNARLFDQTSVE